MAEIQITSCPICLKVFHHDPIALFKESNPSHTPVQSQNCPHKICLPCVIDIQARSTEGQHRTSEKDNEWFECPQCYARNCFNMEDTIVDPHFCHLLKIHSIRTGMIDADNCSDEELEDKVVTGNPQDAKRIRLTTKLAPSIDSSMYHGEEKKSVSCLAMRTSSKTMAVTEHGVSGTETKTAYTTLLSSEKTNSRQKLIATASKNKIKRRNTDQRISPNFSQINSQQCEFTKESFLAQPLFLLNSFVDAKERVNQGFGPFVQEGIATPGFLSIEPELANKLQNKSYKEVRDEFLKFHTTPDGSRQAALWLKNAVVGSFIIMRHEYGKCRYCPSWLKKENGKYIGSNYVIGMITKKINSTAEGSADARWIRMKSYFNPPGFPKPPPFAHVEWRWLGMKSGLKPETQKYINVVCQPTVACICNDARKTYAGGATAMSLKEDLWNNATVNIQDVMLQHESGNHWD